MIPYGRQHITEDDIDTVVEVLRSEYLTQGPAVPQFEEAVADYCGAKYGVAMNSATSALHIACLALGLGPGDVLWTSPITFVASANCALYCGAEVDFVDVDPLTYNLCPKALEEKLIEATKFGRLPKIIVPVHLAGQSCDMEAIHCLSKKYGFRIIEDASHAVGARYQNQSVGNLRFSTITIFSFHPVKVITTAEGGIALCNDPQLAEDMKLLRSHGITRDAGRMTCEPEGAWCYQQIELGYNYRMTDVQAGLGISQLRRLDGYIKRRHEIAARYDTGLAGLPLTLPRQHSDSYSAFHLYIVRLQLNHINSSRREIFDLLRAANIGVNVHYIPVHLQPFYQRMGFREGQFPEAERYYAEAISLPMYPLLTDVQQDHVIQTLRKLLIE